MHGDVAEIGPVAVGGDVGDAGRGRDAGERVAACPDVAPHFPGRVVVVLAVLLSPLAAKLEHGGETAEELEVPFGIGGREVDLGIPTTVGARHPGAARPVRQIERIRSRGLADGPLVRIGARSCGGPIDRDRECLCLGKPAFEGDVAVDRTGVVEAAVDEHGVELVFELGRDGARVVLQRGGAATIVDHRDRILRGAPGGNAEQAVASDRGAAVVDVGVGVGGDEGEITVPEFSLDISVDRAEREHEPARRFEIGGE